MASEPLEYILIRFMSTTLATEILSEALWMETGTDIGRRPQGKGA
jgi:hypothetical protein